MTGFWPNFIGVLVLCLVFTLWLILMEGMSR